LDFDLVASWIVFVLIVALFLVVYFAFFWSGVCLLGIICLLLLFGWVLVCLQFRFALVIYFGWAVVFI